MGMPRKEKEGHGMQKPSPCPAVARVGVALDGLQGWGVRRSATKGSPQPK